MSAPRSYDVIVIGGGHAGAEAAWAAANLLQPAGGRVALVTMDQTKIGAMSCNPAIGGLAKGQMVREIDALGGLMGMAADAAGIQFRILNASKGPAVRGPRCQCDKYRYAQQVQRLLATRQNLDIRAAMVEGFLVERGQCVGVHLKCPPAPGQPQADTGGCRSLNQEFLSAGAVVLTTGTFMRGLMHTGASKTHGGRTGEGTSVGMSGTLRRLGFDLGRFKTGTPPRLAAETIDLESLEVQPGDAEPAPFSEMTDLHPQKFPALPQRVCWSTRTNQAIHEKIRANLDRAPMYNGQIETTGPRYCPSIEDKVMRFADRTDHHVFLEPEALDTNEIYCNGISTSLPADVQDYVVHHLPGCGKAKILRYGYAVEYDMVWPHQIDATCMAKRLPGLFLAGQINGTSGYEEAAGQGLVAGINAVRFHRGLDLVRLGRDEAYIGVMMDDLVTKMPREPYRMFTSRAEYRLMLRADNADERLTPLGRELGLADDARWALFEEKRVALEALRVYLASHHADGQPLSRWVLRPGVDAEAVLAQLNGDRLPPQARDRRLIGRLLCDLQYAGYIERQRNQIDRLASLDRNQLPIDLDYRSIAGLRREAAQALNRFRPATLGQAGRLAGVNPADVMIISLAVSS